MSGDGQMPDADPISLEIHHVNVTNGDGSIIMVKQGNTVLKSILIDISGLNQGPTQMQAYWSRYGIGDTFDYMAVSHYHKDHMTGIVKAQPKFDSYIDIGGYWQSADKVEPINPTYEKSLTFNKYKEYIRELSDTGIEGQAPGVGHAKRVNIPFIVSSKDGEHNPLTSNEIILFESGTDKISLFCVAADGILADGTNVMELQSKEKQGNAKNKPASSVSSANNYSLAFLLAWPTQNFYYYTAGDLSGDPDLQHYLNIEGPLVNYLKNGYLKDKPLSAMKADHHGSSYNTYGPYKNDKGEDIPGFLDQLAPTTIIVPTNLLLGAPGSAFYTRVKMWGIDKNKDKPEDKNKACVYFVNECVYSSNLTYPGTTYADANQLVNSTQLPSNLVYWTGSEEPGANGDPIENTRLVTQNNGNKDNKPCAICIRVPSIGNWRPPPVGGQAGGDNSNAAPAFPVTCELIPKNNHDVWILSGSYILPEGKSGPSQSKALFPFPKAFKANTIAGVNSMAMLLNEEAELVWKGRTTQENMDLVKNNLPKLGAWQDMYIQDQIAKVESCNKNVEDDFIASLVGVISDQLEALYTIKPKPDFDEYTLRLENLGLMSPGEQKTLFNFVFASQTGWQSFFVGDETKNEPVQIYQDPNPPAPETSKKRRSLRFSKSLAQPKKKVKQRD